MLSFLSHKVEQSTFVFITCLAEFERQCQDQNSSAQVVAMQLNLQSRISALQQRLELAAAKKGLNQNQSVVETQSLTN